MEEDFDWSRHLEDGEEVLWQGRPRRGWFSGGWYQGGLLVAFCAVTPFMLLYLVVNSGPPPAAIVFFFLFAISGLIFERSVRRKRAFAITDRRALQITNNVFLAETRFEADTKAMLLNKRILRVFKAGASTIYHYLGSAEQASWWHYWLHKPKPGDVLIGLILDATEPLRIAAAQIRAVREREAGDGPA